MLWGAQKMSPLEDCPRHLGPSHLKCAELNKDKDGEDEGCADG